MDIQKGNIALKSFVDLYAVLKAINKAINCQDFFAKRKNEKLLLISLNILDLLLDIFSCHNDFIKLSLYIDKNRQDIKLEDFNKKLRLLNHSRFTFKNRLWAFKLYQTSTFGAFLWWAILIPLRMIIYNKKIAY